MSPFLWQNINKFLVFVKHHKSFYFLIITSNNDGIGQQTKGILLSFFNLWCHFSADERCLHNQLRNVNGSLNNLLWVLKIFYKLLHLLVRRRTTMMNNHMNNQEKIVNPSLMNQAYAWGSVLVLCLSSIKQG